MEQNLKKRNIFVCLIFSILTCGIYSIYWLYTLLDTTYKLTEYDGSPILDIIFTFITCGLYGFYLWYKVARLHSEINENHNIKSVNNMLLYIILYFFGLAIINYCILQDDINKVCDSINNNKYNNDTPNKPYDTSEKDNTKFIVDDKKESYEDSYDADNEITPDIYDVDNEQGFEQIYDEEEQKFDEVYDIDDDNL